MVGVQDEDAVQRTLEHGVDLVLFAGVGKHHVQKVTRVTQAVLRVHVGLAYGVFVGHGDQRRHLGDQTDGRDFAVFRVVDVSAVMVEGRQGADQAGHDGHRVRITAKATQEKLHLLMDHGVVGHKAGEVFFLDRVGQVAVEQQMAGFHEVAVGGQLLNGVTAVHQLALVAINVGDG